MKSIKERCRELGGRAHSAAQDGVSADLAVAVKWYSVAASVLRTTTKRMCTAGVSNLEHQFLALPFISYRSAV